MNTPMNTPMNTTDALPHLAETLAATTRYLDSVTALTSQSAAQPSLLPRWTRGHVVTHVARNADGLANLLRTGQTGTEIFMYPSVASRNEGIEAGAHRPVAELLADSVASAQRWAQAAKDLEPSQFDVGVKRLPDGDPIPVRDVGFLRRTEVEVHHADLGVGYTHHDWPEDFVSLLLLRREGELRSADIALTIECTDTSQTWSSSVSGVGGPTVSGAATDLAWWLIGRGSGDGLVSSVGDLPDLGRWV